VLSILAGLAVGLVFVRRQRTLADPMIDVALFRIAAFNAALATNFLAIFVAVGYFLFVAQYLQLVVGLSPLEAGLWSLPSAVGFIAGSQLGPRIVQQVRPAFVIGGGLACPPSVSRCSPRSMPPAAWSPSSPVRSSFRWDSPRCSG